MRMQILFAIFITAKKIELTNNQEIMGKRTISVHDFQKYLKNKVLKRSVELDACEPLGC